MAEYDWWHLDIRGELGSCWFNLLTKQQVWSSRVQQVTQKLSLTALAKVIMYGSRTYNWWDQGWCGEVDTKVWHRGVRYSCKGHCAYLRCLGPGFESWTFESLSLLLGHVLFSLLLLLFSIRTPRYSPTFPIFKAENNSIARHTWTKGQ